MKREISTWIEWAWLNNLVTQDRQSIDAAAEALVCALQKKFASRFGSKEESRAALAEHIEKTLRALTYGCRTPENVHPLRRAQVESSMASNPLMAA